MIGLLLQNIIRFVALILFQALILNHLTIFSGWGQPFLYVYILIVLPINIPKRILLPIGFIVGLSVDFFTHTPGIHASAALTMVFVRPYILKALRSREGYDSTVPSVSTMGSSKFYVYSFILILIHHIWLFSLLYFSSGLWLYILGHAIVSAIFTFILSLLLHFFAQPLKYV
jgi:rod shape-determining protein MreD